MISHLSIKNIALIRELNLDLKEGLNILSGETGAGKSIIIDSINFVLGDRADRSLIRHGENSAYVEVVFSDIKNYSEIKKILLNSGIDSDENFIIISRSMTNERSECRINHKIVTLSLLRNLITLLVDTHTQNEHQSLLKVNNHIKLLDAFDIKIEKPLMEYRSLLKEYENIKLQLSEYKSQQERERQIDILNFQINEIEKANLQENEEEDLRTKRSLYYNAQKIYSNLHDAYGSLSDYNGGVLTSIKQTINSLLAISQYDDELGNLIERLDSCYIELEDISSTISYKNSADDISSINVDTIEKRLEDIRLIKKKYGKTYQEITDFYNKAQELLDSLVNSEENINKLLQKKENIEAKLIEQSIQLHNLRLATSKKFCKIIMENLNQLGMKNSVFEIKSDFCSEKIIEKLNNNGSENIEFMLSPNLGEPTKPLAKIASGGEMSRFMLAIKNVVAEIDNVDTLIFDEIDTGISGNIAKIVSQKLYNIAKNRQVIAITHLPQLASMGDVNFLIEKKVVDNKTLTFVKELNNDETYKEIMRLSGAIENSKIGLSNAIELKKQADLYKSSLK